MLPPWSSTISRTMDNPSPRPAAFILGERFSCRNRSKTKGRNSGSMPLPVSETVHSTSPRRLVTLNVMDPPPGVTSVHCSTSLLTPDERDEDLQGIAVYLQK